MGGGGKRWGILWPRDGCARLSGARTSPLLGFGGGRQYLQLNDEDEDGQSISPTPQPLTLLRIHTHVSRVDRIKRLEL